MRFLDRSFACIALILLTVGRLTAAEAAPTKVTWTGSDWEAAQKALDAGDYRAALAEHVRNEFNNVHTDRLARYDFDRLRLEEIIREAKTPFEKLQQARAYRYFHRTQEASEVYQTLAQEFPKSPLLLCEFAMAALEMGNEVTAKQLLADAEKLQPTSGYVLAARGALLQAQGKFAEAVTAYDAAIQANPYIIGLHGRRMLLQQELLDSGKVQLKPETSPMVYARKSASEIAEFTLGFPWRLPDKLVTIEGSKPLEAAMTRFYRGDIQGAAAALEKLRDEPGLAKEEQAELAELVGLDYLAVSDYGRARDAENLGNAAPVDRGPERAVKQFDGSVSIPRANIQLTWVDDITRDRLMGQAALVGLLPLHPKTQEDYWLLAAGTAYNALGASPTVGGSAEDSARQTLAKANEYLAKAREAPSLAANDPITAGVKLLPPASEVTRLLAEVQPAAVLAGDREMKLPRAVTGIQPTTFWVRLADFAEALQPSTLGRLRNRYSVREVARTYLNGEQRDYYRLFYDCGLQFRQAKDVRQSQERANELFKRSEKMPEAAYQLALSYDKGLGIEPSRNMAANYYFDAVRGGYQPAKKRADELIVELKKEDEEQYKKLEEQFGAAEAGVIDFYSGDGSGSSRTPEGGVGPLGPSHLRFPKITSYGDALRSEAARGEAEAEWLLGLCYLWGKLDSWRLPEGKGQRTYKPDPEQAFQWFLKAAEQGHPNAEFLVGRAYFFGFGVAADPAQAKLWLEKANQHGDQYAPYLLRETKLTSDMLGQLSSDALNIAFGDPKADNPPLKKLQKEADKGVAEAQFYVALVMQVYGDVKGAKALFEKAADQGMAAAQVSLAEYYANDESEDGVPLDLEKARALYQKAAAQGEKQALLMMKKKEFAFPATLPEPNTEASKAEAQKALEMVRNATTLSEAKIGTERIIMLTKARDALAARFLGNLMTGTETKFIKGDRKAMLNWWTYAAKLGDVEAQYSLGLDYFVTSSDTGNYEESIRWLEMAIKGNHPKAAEQLEVVKKAMAEAAKPKPNMGAEKLKELREKVEPVIAELSQKIEAEPSNGKLYEDRAGAYLLAGQDEAALKDAEKTIELMPESDDGYGLRYMALSLLGRKEEAAAALAKYKERYPGRVERMEKELKDLLESRQ